MKAKIIVEKTKKEQLVDYCMEQLKNVPLSGFIMNRLEKNNENTRYSSNVFIGVKNGVISDGCSTSSYTPCAYERDFIRFYDEIIYKVGLENEEELKRNIVEFLLEQFMNGICNKAFEREIVTTRKAIYRILVEDGEKCRKPLYGEKLLHRQREYCDNMRNYMYQNFNICTPITKKYYSVFDDSSSIHPDIDLYYFCKSLFTTQDGQFNDYDFKNYMCKYIFSFIDNYCFVYQVDVVEKHKQQLEEMKKWEENFFTNISA